MYEQLTVVENMSNDYHNQLRHEIKRQIRREVRRQIKEAAPRQAELSSDSDSDSDVEGTKCLKLNGFLKTSTDFANTTTLNGVSYIVEIAGNPITKVFWAIMVLTFSTIGIIWSYQAYTAWVDDPILTTIATTGLPVQDIKFPAITICGQVKIEILINYLNF